MMKRLIRFILQYTIRPFLQNYWLRSARQSSFGGIKLEVPVSVFHPGLYFSSRFMARFISSLDLQDKTVLDLGAGSGILSLVASNLGAKVTAIDINPMCVEATRKNAQRNRLALEVIQSDLFTNVRVKYDFVFINPPYFPKEPKQPTDQAWYCGKEFTYFDRLFQGIDKVLAEHARTFMVLSEVCAICSITSIAHKYGFEFHILEKKNYIFEENYILEIRATND